MTIKILIVMKGFCKKCGCELNAKSRCVPCLKEYQKQYRETHKERKNELYRVWRAKIGDEYKSKKYRYYSSVEGRTVELVSRSKRRANAKKIEHTLTTDFVRKMWEQQNGCCALTGISFEIPQDRTCGKGTPFAPSIDRIDCSIGYIESNVRLVCLIVNYALNEFGETNFKTMCEHYSLKHSS